MDIFNYIMIFWRRKWVVAVTTFMTGLVVVIGTLTASPIYVASATLRVSTAAAGSVDYGFYMYAERLMNTFVQIATSDPVLDELMQVLDLDQLPEIEVTVLSNTELMRIAVEDADPLLAQHVANTLAEILVAQSRELYRGGGKSAAEILNEQLSQIEIELNAAQKEYNRLVGESPEESERITKLRRSIELKQNIFASLLSQYEEVRVNEALRDNMLSIAEYASTPISPAKPRTMMNIALGIMVGLAGGVGLIVLFENLDTTLYTVKQIEETVALSSIGKIPVFKEPEQVHFFNGTSPQGEAFRRLRTNILARNHKVSLRTLLITSAEPREGKSTIVSNLAFMLSKLGRKVVVVDSDMRRPTLHTIFGLSNDIGLSNVLMREATLERALQDSEIPQVCVLVSGPLPNNPTELLGSAEMMALIEQLAQTFDMILLDTPALSAVTDAAVLVPMVDGVLLVVGRGLTRKENLRAARQQLADVKAHIVGVVVNRAEKDGTYAYYQNISS